MKLPAEVERGVREAPRLTRVAVGDQKRWCVQMGTEAWAFLSGETLGQLLSLTTSELRSRLDDVVAAGERVDFDRVLAPVDDDTEVWAAGVTYEVSRGARMEESAAADIYEQVYDAERPELFFKSVGWRTAGPDSPIGVRADSRWNVPEPELALVVNAHQEVVGFTICNDVSSRSIEAANPLYLPQAKCYRGGCAIGPWIVPVWAVDDPYSLTISMEIERDSSSVWSGATSTRLLHRRFDDLVSHLFGADVFPRGVIVSTGTAAVPSNEFSLMGGDTVVISIESVGTLVNPVLSGRDDPRWETP